MPVNYKNAKIYKITSGDKLYIGSTTQFLSQALSGLRYNSTQAVKSIIFDKNCEITLIENYPCDSREQLLMRQRFHIENNPNCINKNKKCICTEEEKQETITQQRKDKRQREKLEKEHREFNNMLLMSTYGKKV